MLLEWAVTNGYRVASQANVIIVIHFALRLLDTDVQHCILCEPLQQ